MVSDCNGDSSLRCNGVFLTLEDLLEEVSSLVTSMGVCGLDDLLLEVGVATWGVAGLLLVLENDKLL